MAILFEHLELNKKPHHWFGAWLKKKNWLYYLRKHKNKKTKIKTWKKIKIEGLIKTNCRLVILITFLFGPVSLEMKLFDTKLYFTCILILEVEKDKRNSSKNYKEKRKLAKAS